MFVYNQLPMLQLNRKARDNTSFTLAQLQQENLNRRQVNSTINSIKKRLPLWRTTEPLVQSFHRFQKRETSSAITLCRVIANTDWNATWDELHKLLAQLRNLCSSFEEDTTFHFEERQTRCTVLGVFNTSLFEALAKLFSELFTLVTHSTKQTVPFNFRQNILRDFVTLSQHIIKFQNKCYETNLDRVFAFFKIVQGNGVAIIEWKRRFATLNLFNCVTVGRRSGPAAPEVEIFILPHFGTVRVTNPLTVLRYPVFSPAAARWLDKLGFFPNLPCL